MPEDVLLDFFAFYTEFLKTKTFDGKILYCFSLSKTSGLDFTCTCIVTIPYCTCTVSQMISRLLGYGV